jgi:hypothetical protein
MYNEVILQISIYKMIFFTTNFYYITNFFQHEIFLKNGNLSYLLHAIYLIKNFYVLRVTFYIKNAKSFCIFQPVY